MCLRMFHRLQELNVDAIICAGIGAGLESMTVNPMAWEGSVNPKVCSQPLCAYLLELFFFMFSDS